MLVARGQITIWACQDGESMTLRGQWRAGTVTPYLGVVRMGRALFACNVRAGSANPPMWCYTDAQGNYYTYADGGYVLTGEMNTAEYVLIAEDGYDGTDGIDGTDGTDGTSIIWKGSFAAHPENPQNGWAYKNTADKKSYIYQDGAWYQMTIDGIDGKNGDPGKDGIGITWKGDSATPPVNPQINWVYRDTNNGKVYIYNGTAWSLMVVDGTNGKPGAKGDDGLSVFITYHDSITTPAKPTGDGSSGGWHHNTTAATKWMSQKVAASVSVGTWGNPILIKGDKGDKGNKGDKGDKGDSITVSGEWRSGTTTPYLGVVRMCGNSFICINPKGSTTAPYCIFTDNLGNCFTYADGGYVLTGEMNTTDYQLMTESGRDGCIIRKSRWVSGVEYHNDAQINTQIRYLDIALLENDAMSTGYIPYRCKKTHVASAANKPTSGGNEWWEEVTNNDIIYTDFFIAKNASIDLFQGNNVFIKKNDNTVTAGMSGTNNGDKTRIWAGGSVPDQAPFAVNELGEVTAEKFRTARSGLRLEVHNGLIEVFGLMAKNIEFGLNNEGMAVLRYYDNGGNLLYDLGPNGLETSPVREEKWVDVIWTSLGTDIRKVFTTNFALACNPRTGKTYYKYISKINNGVNLDQENDGKYFISQTVSIGNRVPDGWYIRTFKSGVPDDYNRGEWMNRGDGSMPSDMSMFNPPISVTPGKKVYVNTAFQIQNGSIVATQSIYYN